MKKDYLKLPVEELLEVEEFIAWMRHGKHQKEWESFLNENPEFIENVNKARKMMELLNDRHDHISEQDLLKIWKNIQHFDLQIRRGKLHFLVNTVMRYAAILIILFSIGSAGLWVFNRNQKLYVYTTAADSGKNSKSKLHLSNGTTVDLEKDNSKIALNGDQRVIIDNEKVIDLSKSTIQDVSAMNEVVINLGATSGMVELRMEVDGHFVSNQRADGMIIASPTGSTAYSLSAGGPLLHPSIPGWVLVPIAPHTLSNRPIVLANATEIVVEIVAGRDASANFDMQSLASLMHGDRIVVTKSDYQVRFLHPKGWSYFDTLREKLHWNEGVA